MLIYVKESVGYKETEFACYLQLPVKRVFWSVLSCYVWLRAYMRFTFITDEKQISKKFVLDKKKINLFATFNCPQNVAS